LSEIQIIGGDLSGMFFCTLKGITFFPYVQSFQTIISHHTTWRVKWLRKNFRAIWEKESDSWQTESLKDVPF